MHITEGIITGTTAVVYTGAGIALVALGTARMKHFIRQAPENKPLLGMGAALIFFLSLIPIPAFTGTCSHPCGTPLIAILLGPLIGIALTGASLLLQAAFFAHGGFGTWGANVVALGLFGCMAGWGVFRLSRQAGLPLWAAGCLGGFFGDIMVYAASGLILSQALVLAPQPQYGFWEYLTVVYTAYLPTQLPIAFGEMAVTGLALNYAYRQRPEVLEALGVIRPAGRNASLPILLMCFAILPLLFFTKSDAATSKPQPAVATFATAAAPKALTGMDEAVNQRLAQQAGRPSQEPFLNTEALGDLWNLLLLGAGGVCGFIIGRYWHLLFGPKQADQAALRKGS